MWMGLIMKRLSSQRLLPSMITKLNLLVRNRRFHYAVLVLLFLGFTLHIFHSQGISIDYTGPDRNLKVHHYTSTVDVINSNILVTDVRITRCVRGFSCDYPKDNQWPGWWEEMPTKLNLFLYFSLFNYYMYVKKVKCNESKLFVTDITFTYSDEPPKTGLEGTKWRKQHLFKNAFMWINYIDSLEYHIPLVRDLNVLYGQQDMQDFRPHWKFESGAVLLPVKQSIKCSISVLQIPVNKEIAILNAEQEFDLVLKKNSIFATSYPTLKILQVSDMHIGQDSGTCYEKCKYDQVTLDLLKDVIDKEEGAKLMIITGDMIDYNRALHFESVILKALAPVLRARVPFVFLFGNSDYDPNRMHSKLNVANFITSLPGCYNQKFEDLEHRVRGLTNGNIKIYYTPDAPETGILDYNILDLAKPNAIVTYLDSSDQVIDESQANFLHRINHNLNDAVEQKLLFLHHPLPNFRPRGSVKLIGTYNEKHELITPTDEKILQDIKAAGYKGVGVGHEHENDACIWDENDGTKILLCYSGVIGESANMRLNSEYKRRMRVFQLDFTQNRILSWKRDPEQLFDPQEIWSAE